jgi:hypothetical protein
MPQEYQTSERVPAHYSVLILLTLCAIGDAAAQTWRVSAAELIPELERVGFDDCDTRSAVFRRQAGEPAIPRG